MLRSVTFKDDPALQACLQHDSAHIVPGAKGPHVARIHSALLLLDRAPINASELRNRRYGPTTAAAVLAYKRKRRIINFSYQKSADDIVGKMTIARLDSDILDVERRHTSRAVCGGSTGSVRRSAEASAAAVGDRIARTKHVCQLRLAYQTTSLGQSLIGLTRLPGLIQRARVLMLPHGISFADDVPLIGPVIPHDFLVDVHFNSDAFAVRQKSVAVSPGLENVLRVIFCPFVPANPYFGSTHGGQPVDGFPAVPKFVLINTSRSHADDGTLLHEMIHAAIPGDSLPHDEDNPRSVYSTAEGGRDQLTEKRAAQLAGAYFK